jgi:DNA-binding NarL/FixJ family response regulator
MNERLEAGTEFDLILMNYSLPGTNGPRLAKTLQEKGVRIPVVLMSIHKDFDMVTELLRSGIQEFVLADDARAPDLPARLLDVIRREEERKAKVAREVSASRLQAIQELIVKITQDIRPPMDEIKVEVDELLGKHEFDNLTAYIAIIRDNHQRIEKKIKKLKELDNDETIPYIKEIRMFDLS